MGKDFATRQAHSAWHRDYTGYFLFWAHDRGQNYKYFGEHYFKYYEVEYLEEKMYI